MVGRGRPSSRRGVRLLAPAALAVLLSVVSANPAVVPTDASDRSPIVGGGATRDGGHRHGIARKREAGTGAKQLSDGGQVPDRDLFSAGREYRSPGDVRKVVVYEPADPAGVPGFEPLWSGPGFVVGTTRSEPTRIPGEIEVRDDMNLVRLANATFDSTVGEPLVPEGLAASLKESSAGDNSRFLALVQAPGPLHDAWFRRLVEAGAEPVSYIPENAYVVLVDRGAYERLGELQRLGQLQYRGPYHPYYAVEPSLLDDGGPAPTGILVPDSPEGYAAIRAVGGDTTSSEVVHVGTMLATIVELEPRRALELAKRLPVLRVEKLPPLRAHDEKPAQWAAGARTSDRSDATGPGYLTWYASKGFGGDPGFAIEIADSGLSNLPGYLHPDFRGPAGFSRVVAAYDYTGTGVADTDGHGTAVAGLAAGRNSGTGPNVEDSAGYNYGIGIDPEARLVVSKNMTAASGSFAIDYLTRGPQAAYRAGARISNNSWGTSGDVISSYTIYSALYDSYTRDVLPDPGEQQMAFVFAAGNEGPSPSTVGSPANAKNVIAVGANENNRPGWIDRCDQVLGDFDLPADNADNMNDLLSFSSRGPTADWRLKPELVAPGHHVTAPLAADGVCPGSGLPSIPGYTAASGTSFAAPQVTGALGLVARWFKKNGWKDPSPAMLKAYVTTGTQRLSGTGTSTQFPYYDQGFGALALDPILTDAVIPLIDQSVVFSDTGQIFETALTVHDTAKPVVVTLAWSDAPGNSAGAAYVNDLDLEVVAGGQTYRSSPGSGEFTTPGGASDTRTNLERVKLPPGTSGSIKVRVRAKNIAGDGVFHNNDFTDQDFALVVSNLGAATLLSLDSFALTDLGDGNGRVGNPEPFEARATIRNFGSSAAESVTATLESLVPGVTFARDSATFGSIQSGGTSTNSLPFKGSYAGDCSTGIALVLRVWSEAASFAFNLVLPTDPRYEARYADTAVEVPDGSTGEIPLVFQGPGQIQRAMVTVSVGHPEIGELEFSVVSPQGREVLLASGRGWGNTTGMFTFFDGAYQPASLIGSPVDPAFGEYRPEQSLGQLNGYPAAGTWKVRVRDRVFSGGAPAGRFWAAIHVVYGCIQPRCTTRPTPPASAAYLAEGATAGAFDTWVLVANPSSTRAVTACVTFLTDSGPVAGPVVRLAPLSRQSIAADSWVQSYDVATVVEGFDGAVLAERAMYSWQPGLVGAHAVKGSTELARSWFLAEGATSGPFETWVLVANPSATETANVSVTYLTDSGPRSGPIFAVGPQQRRSVRVDDTVDTYHVSTLVTSTGAAVIAERATYASGEGRTGATASPGARFTASEWFLAEGATSGPFETWILIANPSDSQQAQARVELMTQSGVAQQVELVVPPRSRRTVRADDYVDSYDVSTRVTSTGATVVAERAMYLSASSLGSGAASGEGVTSPGAEWFAVEGATAGGFETWVLIANPGSTTVQVNVQFLSTGGIAASTSRSIPPRSRLSVRADDYIDSFDVATRVRVQGSGSVIVERATYTPGSLTGDSTASPAARTG